MAEAAPLPGRETDLARLWEAGSGRALRLEDGRALRVIFPGVRGGGAGPDFTGATLDAGGDYLRGDVELHLRASGWRAHGHESDPAYGGVVLHVVAANDGATPVTFHASGRTIPILVLRGATASYPPPFTPPCTFAGERGYAVEETLVRMGARRLRQKASRVGPLLASDGPAQALYTLVLETLAGPANGASFATIARALPLAALVEQADQRASGERAFALEAALKGAAAGVALRRAGLRPAASPGRRLGCAARLIHRLWPEGAALTLPALPAEPRALLQLLKVEGAGREMGIELAVNAVLPVLLATGVECTSLLAALPAPGTYGKLRALERWLGHGERVFRTAAALQGGLLLHGEYCTRGHCGNCPLSK